MARPTSYIFRFLFLVLYYLSFLVLFSQPAYPPITESFDFYPAKHKRDTYFEQKWAIHKNIWGNLSFNLTSESHIINGFRIIDRINVHTCAVINVYEYDSIGRVVKIFNHYPNHYGHEFIYNYSTNGCVEILSTSFYNLAIRNNEKFVIPDASSILDKPEYNRFYSCHDSNGTIALIDSSDHQNKASTGRVIRKSMVQKNKQIIIELNRDGTYSSKDETYILDDSTYVELMYTNAYHDTLNLIERKYYYVKTNSLDQKYVKMKLKKIKKIYSCKRRDSIHLIYRSTKSAYTVFGVTHGHF